MQYALLVYQGERWATLTKAEKGRVHDDCARWHQELVLGGQARTAAGLRSVATATTVRAAHGAPVVSDGPYAETKEVLGGFEIIECKDLDAALAIAKRFPALRVGFAMEVRPLATDCREED
jgi:hypothetical protein